MTIKLPSKSVSDRLLEALGKKRAVTIPEGIYEKFGPHVYAFVKKESFFKALLRPKGRKPPAGYFYPDSHPTSDQ